MRSSAPDAWRAATFEARGQVVLVGPPGVAGVIGQPGGRFPYPGGFQLGGEVGLRLVPTPRRRGPRRARAVDRLGAALPHPRVRPPATLEREAPRVDPRRNRARLSNRRIESVNTKIRLITRVAYGFRSPQALIALAMLNLGGHRPTLPGRN